MEPADLFKQLSDETRLRCLSLMVHEGELCVCELTYALGLSQPKISRHLAQLRELGVVQSRRQGLWVHYRLHEDLPPWAIQIIDSFSHAAISKEPYESDLKLLCGMSDRPGSVFCA